MRVDGATNTELIHQKSARLDLAADADLVARDADRHQQPHVCRNAQVGRITCFIFKQDRADLCCARVSKTMGRCSDGGGRVLRRINDH